MMRWLLGLVVTLAAIYSGYWFIGSRAVENSARSALVDLGLQGWDVRYDQLNTTGFPSRFDTMVTDVSLRAPTGLQYDAPFLQMLALSYRPNQVIVAFPTTQTIRVGDTALTMSSESMRASAAVRPTPSLPFQEATLVADRLGFATQMGTVRTGPLLAAARNSAGSTYDLYLKLDGITLPDQMWQSVFPDRAAPQSLDHLTIDATADLTQEVSRITMTAAAPPVLNRLEIKTAELLWGEVSVSADGTLTADRSGFATGEVTLVARNLHVLLSGLANGGALPPSQTALLTNLATALSAEGETTRMTVRFANGQMFWGFLPLGPAPRLQSSL